MREFVCYFEESDGTHPPIDVCIAALNLEDQSYFALGYRQMCTQMNADKAAAKAAKEEET